ncbi:MAG: hypothetical protein HKM05_07460 [Spirochaetales bacterium]|nr:hypothetical protein [Spirochaetales bacterium]
MNFDEDLQRLAGLADTDESLIALALHALWEKILRQATGTPYATISAESPVVDAPELLRRLLGQNPSLRRYLDDQFVHDFARSRSWSNAVRHNFVRMETRRFQETLLQFETFCQHFPAFSSRDVVTQTLHRLRQRTCAQKEQHDQEIAALMKRNAALQEQLAQNEAEMTNYLDLAQELNFLNAERSRFKDELDLAELALERLSRDSAQSREELEQRIQDLRAQIEHSQQAQQQASQQMTEYQVYQDYMEVGEELSHYARSESPTRRTVKKLTVEQEQAVNLITEHRGDFYLKGPAGSGKSQVLVVAWYHLQKRYPEEYPLLVSSKPLVSIFEQIISTLGETRSPILVACVEDFLARSGNTSSSSIYPKIFLDDTQDVTGEQLARLRALSRDGLVMAGDFFTPGETTENSASFTLTQSFRCSPAILDYAGQWLPAGLRFPSPLGTPQSFLPPLILKVSDKTVVKTCEVQLRTCIEGQGYRPEEVLIIPFDEQGNFEPRLAKALSGIRISSWRETQGLSFPVVIVVLDQTPNPESAHARGIITALTRASERLIVLTLV